MVHCNEELRGQACDEYPSPFMYRFTVEGAFVEKSFKLSKLEIRRLIKA